MNKIKYLFAILLIACVGLIISCSSNNEDSKKDTKNEQTATKEVSISKSAEVLNYFKAKGDIINNSFPKLIDASEVYDQLGGYIHIIDVRGGKAFAAGHIEGAVNVGLGSLYEYFQNDVDTAAFDQIILVCYSGQSSSYAASVLNLMGSKKVFAMKWGMSAWNKKFMGKWDENSTDDYIDEIEITKSAMANATTLPMLNSDESDVESIVSNRASELLTDGFKSIRVKSDDLFADISKYYIINYDDGALYNVGHIKGSVFYEYQKTLGLEQNLKTLPTDKPIVVYDVNGFNSACTVAYLRMLGYDAYTLLYGANSFMHSKLKENNLEAFSSEMVNDYEFIETEFGGAEEEGGGGC